MAARRRHKAIDLTKVVLILLVLTLVSTVVAHSTYLEDIQSKFPSKPTVLVYVIEPDSESDISKNVSRGDET